MYEIEVKFKFSNKSIDEIKSNLSVLNLEWSEEITQKDKVFLLKDMTEYKIVKGTKILRIRQESKQSSDEIKSIFTMKVQQERALESKEFESEIKNGEQIQLIIQELGFKEFVEVIKTRKKAKYNNYNLCLDYVKDLGVFLEVEFLSEIKIDVQSVQNQIIDWIKSLDLLDYEINKTPYDTQIYLNGLDKK